MDGVDPIRRRTVILDLESFEERCTRRMIDELGLDPEAVEVILNLRRQVTELQARVQELETDLDLHQVRKGTRLARYRQIIYEASWRELT